MQRYTPLTRAQLGLWIAHHQVDDPTLFTVAEALLFRPQTGSHSFAGMLMRSIRETQAAEHSLQWAVRERDGSPCWSPAETAADLERHAVTDLPAALEAVPPLLAHGFDLERGPLNRHVLFEGADGVVLWVHLAHHLALDGYGFSLFERRVAARLAGTSPLAVLEPGAVLEAAELAYVGSESERVDQAFWRGELMGYPPLRLGPTRPLGKGARSTLELGAGMGGRLERAARAERVSAAELLLALSAELLGRRTGQQRFTLGLPVPARWGAITAIPCMAMNILAVPVDLRLGRISSELARQLHALRVRQRPHERYRHEQLRETLGRAPFGCVVNVLPFTRPNWVGCEAEHLLLAAGPVEDVALTFVLGPEKLQLIVDAPPDVLTAAERESLLRELAESLHGWLASPGTYSCWTPVPGASVHAAGPTERWLAHRLERPQQLAVDGAEPASYDELSRLVNGCARQLRELGCRPGEWVALALPRSLRLVVCLLALRSLGVGVTVLDLNHPPLRREQTLRLVKPGLFLSDEPVEGSGVRVVTWGASWLASWRDGPPLPAPPGEPPGPAYTVLTSGTGGEPKAVSVAASALAQFVDAATEVYRWEPSDRVLQFASFAFDASVEELWVALAVGATLVLRDERCLESVRDFVAFCEQHRLTVLDLPTAYFHELAFGLERLGLTLPASVRLVLIGGEAGSAVALKRFFACCPKVRVLNTYGPSEATVVAACTELHADATDPLPIGYPLRGVLALVADEQLKECEEGELLLGGPTLADGYLGAPRLTAERFVHHPTYGRLYRTGDRVRRGADGALVFLGRLDQELKIAGHRVLPSSIETLLLAMEGVTAAVCGAEPASDGALRLVVDVEAAPQLTAVWLRSQLAATLPPALLPTVRTWPRLPRGPTGKLERAPTDSEGAFDLVNEEPELLAVLTVFRELVGSFGMGPDDDFFLAGGTSLLALRLVGRLSRPGRELRLTDVFRAPTARGLAQRLTRSVTLPNGDDRTLELEPVPLPATVARPAQPRRGEPKRWFLTGVTGLVGAHLLMAALDQFDGTLACWIRADSAAAAQRRLAERLSKHGVTLRGFENRVEIHALPPGTSAAELIDRVEPCQQLLHSAAQVSVTRDYRSLVDANVRMTAELLGVAAQWGAAFHQLSSIAVLPPSSCARERFVEAHPGLQDGYQRTKWQAEQLVWEARQRGLRAAVYRLGRVVGARRYPMVSDADLVWRIARTAVRAGIWPELEFKESWISAEVAGQSIVRLVQANSAEHAVGMFHVVERRGVSLGRVRSALERRVGGLRSGTVREVVGWASDRGDDDDRATVSFFELQDAVAERAPLAPEAIERIEADTLYSGLPSDDFDDDYLDALARAAIGSWG